MTTKANHQILSKWLKRATRFIVAVAFLIERDGAILVLRRSRTKDHAPGEWEFGSGRVEYGEHPEDAVHREVRLAPVGRGGDDRQNVDALAVLVELAQIFVAKRVDVVARPLGAT